MPSGYAREYDDEELYGEEDNFGYESYDSNDSDLKAIENITDAEVDAFLEDLKKQDTSAYALYVLDLREQLKKYPLLSKEDEAKLSSTLHDPNATRRAKDDARNTFVMSNLRLVIRVAVRYKSVYGLDFSDIIQEGNLGLMRAVDKFDGTLGNKFSTYACYWIRQAILKCIRDKSRTIKIPAKYPIMQKKIDIITQNYESKFSRKPTLQELADELGESTDNVLIALKYAQGCASLSQIVYGHHTSDDTEKELIDQYIDPSAEEVEDSVFYDDMAMYVDSCIQNSNLTNKELFVLQYRFGFGGVERLTLQEIADRMGLTSRERVRQIEHEAINKIKQKPAMRDKLMSYYNEMFGECGKDPAKDVVEAPKRSKRKRPVKEPTQAAIKHERQRIILD